MNKKNIAIFVFGAILFLLPQMVQSTGENIDTIAIIGFDSFIENGNLTDGKTKAVIRVMSGPTNTLSDVQDLIYNDKVQIDANKPNTWNNRIRDSLITKESTLGRNLTKIIWITGEQIYP